MRTAVTIICLLVSSFAFAQPPAMQRKIPLHSQQMLQPSTFGEKPPQIVPKTFYSEHLGFFCKQELKLQQQRIPVTFRLGSMDYCNQLEQKPGYR